MDKLFLTGEIQIGKSTAIYRALEMLQVEAGGFCTYFGDNRFTAAHALYMREASEAPQYDETHTVARFSPGQSPELDLHRFEEIGLSALENRRGAPLLLMDECGKLEREAVRFQAKVLSLLDAPIPILGVVRQDTAGWLDAIRHHPRVKLLTVTQENRESIPGEIVRLLSLYLAH